MQRTLDVWYLTRVNNGAGSRRSPNCKRFGWLLLAAGTWAALLFGAASVRAQAEARVALVTSEPSSPTANRVRAELRELGVDVVLVEPARELPLGRVPLEQLARGVGAFAAIRVVPLGAGAEVWVADRVTGKTVVREVLRGADAAGTTEDTVAVGAVELLRASLLELTLTDRPPQGEVAPSPQLRQIARVRPEAERRPAPSPSRRHSWSLTLSPGAVWSVGGVAPAFFGQLAVGYSSPGWAGGELYVGTSGQTEVEAAAGSAALVFSIAGLGLSYSSPTAKLTPILGGGVAAVHLSARGHAEAPWLETTDSLWMPAGYLRVGLGWECIPYVRLRAGTTVLGTLKSMKVRFGGNEVARWGQPALLAEFGLELLVPREQAAP